jgi:glutamate/aspartate transport system substrate-binding protein
MSLPDFRALPRPANRTDATACRQEQPKIAGKSPALLLSLAAFEDGMQPPIPVWPGLNRRQIGHRPARPSHNASMVSGRHHASEENTMNQMRLIGVAFAAALCAGQANAEELTGTLKNIKETGTITLGFRDTSIPFSYLDDNQKPIVDAVKKELKLDKLEVKLNPVTSATRIPLMANGTVDLECGSTTNNAERQKQVSFTNTHFLTASRYVSKKSSKINSIDDLKGKSVVSTSGTTNIKQLTEANAARNLGANIIPAKDHAEAFLMVETDRAVAFVMDDILLASLVAGSKDPGAYVISKDAFSKPEPYGIMLRKDDAAFKKVVDAATAALYQSGEGERLYDKWFMQKIPPKALNLNAPISAELKHEFAKPSDSPDPDYYKAM